MKLVAAKCPSCGANLEVNPNQEALKCQYCGNYFLFFQRYTAMPVTNPARAGHTHPNPLSENGRICAAFSVSHSV